jgi:hypothetical protein
MVGVALYLTSKFTVKAISSLVLFTRYITGSMALRYGYSEPNTSYPSWHGRKGSISFSKALMTMGVLDR